MQSEFFWHDSSLRIPIPKLFHSLEHEGPFVNCTMCGSSLRGRDDRYIVQRVFQQDEPILELAMCMSCRDEQSLELSDESRERIEQYIRQTLDLQPRVEKITQIESIDSLDPWLNECLLTGHTWSTVSRRSICGICYGDELELGHLFPYMITGVAEEALSDRVSQKTRDWLSDFVGTHFGMPPEFCDTPDMAPIFF
jgi:hypothetical protein